MKNSFWFLLFISTWNLFATGEKEGSSLPQVNTPGSTLIPLPSELSSESFKIRIETQELNFSPGEVNLEKWKRLEQSEESLKVALLELILHSHDISPQEKAGAQYLLANLFYENGLFLRSMDLFIQCLSLIQSPLIRLRIVEIGTFYKDWNRDQILTGLSGLRNSDFKLERDNDIFRLLRAKTLWTRYDVGSWGMTENSLSALALDGDDLWAGTWNGGIFRFSRSTLTAKVFQPGQYKLTPNSIKSIQVDPFAVWFAGLDGIHRYNKVNEQWRTYPLPPEVQAERVQGMYRIHSRLYLVTLGHGIWRLDRTEWEKMNTGNASEMVTILKETSNGNVFLGTMDRGLFLWNPERNTLNSFFNSQTRLPRNITALEEDAEYLWIGTYGEGLFRFNKNSNTMTHYTKRSGELPDDWIMSSTSYQKFLYFGTFGGGLIRVIPDPTPVFTPLEPFGSPSDILSIAVQRDWVWLGTLKEGLVILHPEGLDENR